MNPHIYADAIKAWADRAEIQAACMGTMNWRDDYPVDAYGTPMWNHPDYKWRIKPRGCSINGHKFPEPEIDAPPSGTEYWTPCHEQQLASNYLWHGTELDWVRLQNRRVHLTESAAEAHALAEIGVIK